MMGARVVTTRKFEIAAAPQQRAEVAEMTSDEAIRMLTAPLTQAPPNLARRRGLTARLGEWPLLLELAAGVLRQRLARGGAADDALAFLNTALDHRGATAFDQRDATARNQAVTRSLGISQELLRPDEQRRYRELAIFPDDTAIPLTALSALWGLDEFDTETLVDGLADLSLLRYDLPRRSVRLNDVVSYYLGSQLPDPAGLHARLVDAWGDLTVCQKPTLGGGSATIW